MRISKERYEELEKTLEPFELALFEPITTIEKTIKMVEPPLPYKDGRYFSGYQLNPIGENTGVYSDGFGEFIVILSFKNKEDAQLFSREIFG